MWCHNDQSSGRNLINSKRTQYSFSLILQLFRYWLSSGFFQQFETAALDGCKLKKSTNTERTRYNKSNDVKVLHLATNSKSELTYRVGTQRDIRHKLFEIKIERRANFNKKVCSASLIERAAICSFSMRNPNIHLCAIIYI